MINYVNEAVSVITVYNAEARTITPAAMRWNGKRYTIKRVAFYHPVRIGRVLHHVYSVTDGAMDFRLDFNSENQQWCLMEVSDGLAG